MGEGPAGFWRDLRTTAFEPGGTTSKAGGANAGGRERAALAAKAAPALHSRVGRVGVVAAVANRLGGRKRQADVIVAAVGVDVQFLLLKMMCVVMRVCEVMMCRECECVTVIAMFSAVTFNSVMFQVCDDDALW